MAEQPHGQEAHAPDPEEDDLDDLDGTPTASPTTTTQN